MDDWSKALKQYGSCENLSLATLNTFGVGGQAWCFYPRTIESFLDSLSRLRDISFHIIGGGSNILFADRHLSRPIVQLKEGEFSAIRMARKNLLYCGAGVLVSKLLFYSLEHELGGMEFLAGLPATVGGIVKMNASFKGVSIENVLDRVVLLDKKYMSLVEKKIDELDSGYRDLGIDDMIVIGAFFRVQSSNTERIKELIDDNVTYRKVHQEWGVKTAGCIFKNPTNGISAGKLIDECGLKGLSKGDAQISQKHANFIINRSQASSSDILYLINKIKDKVNAQKGILLEEEITRIEC